MSSHEELTAEPRFAGADHGPNCWAAAAEQNTPQQRDAGKNRRQHDHHPNLKSVHHVFLLIFFLPLASATLRQAEKRINPAGISKSTFASPEVFL
jgi:hypothetical protein